LRIKEQETRLTLQEHDNDDEEKIFLCIRQEEGNVNILGGILWKSYKNKDRHERLEKAGFGVQEYIPHMGLIYKNSSQFYAMVQ